jgi:hypothetical protein
MGAAEQFAALCLAFAACPILLAPLPAQTPSQPSTAWVKLGSNATAAHVPAFGSAPNPTASVSPLIAPRIVSVYAVPCAGDGVTRLCIENPYARFLDNTTPLPLSPVQKAHLALRNLTDPANLATIGDTAAIAIAANSHTAYGPGWSGFLRDSHYSFVQNATGEFFATFLIPSLAHQDPHYHRMPSARIPRRVLHAVSSTVLAQSDSGAPMPNLATLFTYPINAEISNLYVPGVNGNGNVNGNGPSTLARILTGYATDPVANLLAEFLPGVARHINVRVIIAQRMLN